MKQKSNSVKSLAYILYFTIFAGNFAYAQPQPQQPPLMLPDSVRIVQMVDEMATALQLSEEQKTQVSELHFIHFAEVKKQIEIDRAVHEKHREAMDTLRKEFEEELKNLLNNDQKSELEKFLKNHSPRPGKQKPGRR